MSQVKKPVSAEDRKKWLILSVICLPLFMILLDVTIVNIALPHIMLAFNVSLSSIEWVINVYVLVFAVLLLTLGKLGDLFGRKLLFIVGLGIFIPGSLMCGVAPNFPFLLVARGIQAVGGAAMMPATLSILNVEFGESGRGLALGIWGAVAGAANALGPIIGGALVDAYSWHWIFLVNIPVGIIALIAAIMIVRESTDPRTTRHIDIPGVLTAMVALFCLTYALVEGQSYGWTSTTILGLFTVSVLSFVAFILIELHISSPFIQLRLFRNRTFTAGNIVGLVIMFGLIGVIFLLVLFLQIVLGFSAIKAGLTLLPLPVAIMIVAPFAGRLTDKIGGRWLLFAGTFITAVGIYLMSDLSGVTDWTNLVLPLAVCGVGMGLVMAPVTTVVMASTPLEQSGAGAGILATVRQIGSVMGIAVLGAVLQNQLVGNIREALAGIAVIPATIRDQIVLGLTSGSLGIGGANVSSSVPGPLRDQLIALFKDQFAHSLDMTMKTGIIVILIGTIVSLFVAKHASPKTRTTPPGTLI